MVLLVGWWTLQPVHVCMIIVFVSMYTCCTYVSILGCLHTHSWHPSIPCSRFTCLSLFTSHGLWVPLFSDTVYFDENLA